VCVVGKIGLSSSQWTIRPAKAANIGDNFLERLVVSMVGVLVVVQVSISGLSSTPFLLNFKSFVLIAT